MAHSGVSLPCGALSPMLSPACLMLPRTSWHLWGLWHSLCLCSYCWGKRQLGVWASWLGKERILTLDSWILQYGAHTTLLNCFLICFFFCHLSSKHPHVLPHGSSGLLQLHGQRPQSAAPLGEWCACVTWRESIRLWNSRTTQLWVGTGQIEGNKKIHVQNKIKNVPLAEIGNYFVKSTEPDAATESDGKMVALVQYNTEKYGLFNAFPPQFSLTHFFFL